MDTQTTIEESTLKNQQHLSTITNQKQELSTTNNINYKSFSATCPASPPSASSSPTHEFSFTISLHSSSSSILTNSATKSLLPSYNKAITSNNNCTSTSNNNDKNNSNASFAIDLSPADDIFFHGHLLPLHFLSHLPVSPRSSTNSLDSFTLPIHELLQDQKPDTNTNMNTNQDKNGGASGTTKDRTTNKTSANMKTNKSFSFFGRRKENQEQEEEQAEEEMKNKEKQKKKLRFEQLSQVIKRYAKMVRPMLFFNKSRKRRENVNFHRGAYSFSGSWRSSNSKRNVMIQRGGRRGDYSAPASIRTSPTNSGHLIPTPTLHYSSSSDNSTMEELQAAIQAAIAHCKNSIKSFEDNLSF